MNMKAKESRSQWKGEARLTDENDAGALAGVFGREHGSILAAAEYTVNAAGIHFAAGASIGCSVPVAVAKDRSMSSTERPAHSAPGPQGSILHRGQKCLCRYLLRGRYHHAASFAPTWKPASGS